MSRRRFRFAESIAKPPVGTQIGDMRHLGYGWRADGVAWQPTRFTAADHISGFGANYRNGEACIYATSSGLWLQVGSRGWDCRTIESVVQRTNLPWRTTYTVHQQNGEQHRVTLKMPASVTRDRVTDVTYDEIDSWSDDVMKHFPDEWFDETLGSSETVAEWRERVTPLWQAGVHYHPEAFKR